jgi:serine/threonine protein kinase
MKAADQAAPEMEFVGQGWLQEVTNLASVSSDYIVRIVDAFEDEGYLYTVMEYCAGGSLRSFLIKKSESQQILTEQV